MVPNTDRDRALGAAGVDPVIELKAVGPVGTLAGGFWLPTHAAGPFPCVLMVGGSGATDRHNDVYFPPIREAILEGGFAVASFDKRGVGGSSGDWTIADPIDLVADTIAELAIVRGRPEVASNRVGLFGHSQGGWIVLEVAAKDPKVEFVVTNSGPGTTPGEQELYAMDLALDDIPPAARPGARDLITSVARAANRPTSWKDMRGQIEGLRRGPHFAIYEELGLIPNAELWTRWIRHNPQGALKSIRQPTLAIFGERDRVVPVERSVEIFKRTRGRRPGLTISIIPGANHRMMVGSPAALEPSYLPTLVGWLRSLQPRNR